MGLFDDLIKGAEDLFGKGQCALGFHKGEWKYVYPDQCDQVIHCERCGEKKRLKHQSYTRWQDDPDYQCWEFRTCTRCVDKEERSNHNYSKERAKNEWECYTFIQTCSKCGKEKDKRYSSPKHSWGSWKVNPNVQNEMFRVCNRCNAKEFSKIKD
ncbi:hypothetical protein CRP01_21565 [Flavilitoribacter nigricans DSM 23189 = NBRC 102662]|uniref:Uncharacterized protein n=1 Tax=Flavilitoribacter nigricans (strain ATCC 23147 / DSM 23189 / NBRC 102662 / NCIMB 1420 / SS-2) TaxID=1122177 RepID=A0A2D0N873_FLAN2|nr:hypothetical protein CRP01_21565 [Flavilitoribacter nigricans DSM 23189 = NBRC 102662]